jgi:hypothetical protein
MLEQDINFTYLSENIEKHAKPNNTCQVYDKQSYIRNTHPVVDEINKNYMPNYVQNVLNNLVSKNFLKRDGDNYIVEDHEKQGFPRLMIEIKDQQLLNLSLEKHSQYYEKQKELFKNDPFLMKNFHIINDIQVNEIDDKQYEKVGMIKILGDMKDRLHDVMIFGKNKQTLFAASKRQMKTAPVPDKYIVRDFIKHSIKIIDKELGEELKDFSYDVVQWYNHLSKDKQILIKPIYDLHYHPEKLTNLTTKEMKHLLSTSYQALVKSEIQDLDGKPRMVCQIPQYIKFVMGPVTWMLEEIASKKLQGYCGGLNLDEMSELLNGYIKQGFTKVVEGDGSGFDNTQDVCLKGIDRYIYNKIKDKIYHVRKSEFERIANAYYKTMKVKYIDDYSKKIVKYLVYHVLGTVFSGDCDTTLMNTIRMALYNRYVNDKAGLVYGKDYVVLAKGDDFSVLYQTYVTDERIRQIYKKYFLEKPTDNYEIIDDRQYGIGQILKFLEIGDPSTFKFCSLRSWFKNKDGMEITLTRDPSKLYNKALYSLKYKKYNQKQKCQYHIDQAISYLINYQGIEIFEIIAQAHLKQAELIKKKYNIRLGKLQSIQYRNMIKSKKIKEKEKLKTIEFTSNDCMNDILYKLFDIKKREKYIDLYTSYWEQVGFYEKIRSEHNTINELHYINQQINMEFSTEELKSLLALNKNEH